MGENITISYSEDFVLFNGEPIIYTNSLTALEFSTSLNAIYIASSLPLCIKFI